MNRPFLDDHEPKQRSRDTRVPERSRGSTRERLLTPRFAPLPILFSVSLAFCCCAATARAKALPPAAPQAESQQASAQQLVTDVVWNEIQAQQHDQRHWRFHETQWKSAGRKLYDVIQTKYGDLHRLLAIDGKPLQGKALEAENKRIQRLSSEPEQIAAVQKRRDADSRQEQRLLRMLPQAFIFHRVSQEGDTVKLSFVPNPNFRPSTREAEVFHHMEGTMLVDAQVKRLLQIDGRLTSPVEFWGGLLGHLDAGGTFKVEQRNVGEGHWDMVYLHVEMNGKALFFKTISVHQQEAYSDYRLVPEDLTPQQAARELQEDVESRRDLATQ
jgi:hypothetical protein